MSKDPGEMKEQTSEGRGSQADRRASTCPETNMTDVAARPVCLKHSEHRAQSWERRWER